jgi:hypothetical protein
LKEERRRKEKDRRGRKEGSLELFFWLAVNSQKYFFEKY